MIAEEESDTQQDEADEKQSDEQTGASVAGLITDPVWAAVTVVSSEKDLEDVGLEETIRIILAVRFGRAKHVDKEDVSAIINTIRQVRGIAHNKARGIKKLIVCLI